MIAIGFEGVADVRPVWRFLIEQGYLPPEDPSGVLDGDAPLRPGQLPLPYDALEGRQHVDFGGGVKLIVQARGRAQVNRWDVVVPELGRFLEGLGEVAFRHGSADTLHPELWQEELDYFPGAIPAPLGWGAFFQGEGHRELVSRRWLAHGPWRVLEGANDTTLVQFHALEASAEEALKQARPGHEWLMGGDDQPGGLASNTWADVENAQRHLGQARAMYVHADRTLRIVVQGREVSPMEMLSACHARTHGVPPEGKPVSAVRYVFPERRAAEAHLPALWLRELECWTFDEAGEELRLDEGFHLEPPPPPAWVQRLDGMVEGGRP